MKGLVQDLVSALDMNQECDFRMSAAIPTGE